MNTQKMKRIYSFALLLFMIQISMLAQKVQGIVLDENQEPLIGATVTVRGTQTGTVTDLEGLFTIQVKNLKKDVLGISYLGYQSKFIPINGKRMLSIVLNEEQTELEEVVAVGYGTMRKSDLTGSVTTVKTTDEEAARSTSFDQMLRGKVAGLQLTTGSAAPGGSVSMRIRGISSLHGSTEPLYVVDGHIMDTGETTDPMGAGTGGGNSRMDSQNPLASISPQDIESIEVLKDASATAIYGSRGANGVILITTKQGKTAKPSVTFSANVTTSIMAKQIEMLSADEYLDFSNDYRAIQGFDPLTMEGKEAVNWQDYSTQTAYSQNYRLSLGSKTKSSNYYLAVGYSNNQGIIRETGTNRYDIRLNLDQIINKYVSIKTRTYFSRLNTQMTSGSDKLTNINSSIVRRMLRAKPYVFTDGSSDPYEEDYDPQSTFQIDKWFTDYEDSSRENTFTTNISVDVKPLSWLTFRVNGSLGYKDKKREKWYGALLSNQQSRNGKAGIATLKSDSYRVDALAIFNKRFKSGHNINATLGAEYSYRYSENGSNTAEDFLVQDMRISGFTMGNLIYPYLYSETSSQLFSAFARAVYSYDNRYSLTATFRGDGSSKFSKENRFSFFPSFAAAWRINQEKWLKDVEEISNLKLRVGWGQVGNQGVSDYQYLLSYGDVQYSTESDQPIIGLQPSKIANPNLKWERSTQLNAGLDLGFFNQRLALTADVYVKDTKDLLQQISLGAHAGFQRMWVNNGSLRNCGLEIALEGTPVQTRDWFFSLGGNISIGRNKIMNLGLPPGDFGIIKNTSGYLGSAVGMGQLSQPATIMLEGYPILYYGYQSDGIMQQDEYDAQDPEKRMHVTGIEVEPGDLKYVDQNKDGQIDGDDGCIIGNPNPDFIYGISATLGYKRFTLSLAFDGVFGNDIFNANLLNDWDVKNDGGNVRPEAYYQAWTPENGGNTFPRIGFNNSHGLLTERYIEDGSYFRLANVTLSYELPFKRSKAIRSLVFSGTVSNVFCLTSYTGFDPDVQLTQSLSHIGVDSGAYPAARHFSVNIIANF